MSKVMLFKRGTHAKDVDMRYLDPTEQKHHYEKFKAAGYLENPQLVFMYHPETRQQLPVLPEDQKTFESYGFFATPTWVYHPKDAPRGKIVSNVEAQQLFQNGWFDNPGKFRDAKKGAA